MIDIEELKRYTKNLTILFADDALEVQEMYHYFFDGLFKRVISASDGEEAFEHYLAEEDSIDLILTDQFMPKMNGIDMIRKVRERNKKIPIILVTATRDQEDLINAINLNVTGFIEKPIKYENIVSAVEQSIQRVIVDNLVQKTRQQELELLKYKNAYSNFQEGEAFKKQLNIIKNEIFKRWIEIEKDHYLLVEHFYEPKDTLSGDTYSIHRVGDKVFFFIVDAMGKGISASVSTLVSASFINYYFETSRETFSFEETINKYTDFIKHSLLEDEIISALFGELDLVEQKLKVVNFSMPPVLAVTQKDELIKIGRTSLPITPYTDSFTVDEVDLKNLKKFIFYSDGLTENITDSGVQYIEYVGEDFKKAHSKSHFMKLFREKVKEQEDDTTLLYFEQLDLKDHEIKTASHPSTLLAIDEALEEFGMILDENNLEIVEKMRLESGFTELIMNAHEHGNLGIDSHMKQELMETGEYSGYLDRAEKENSGKKILIQYYSINGYIVLKIQDEGRGFDTNILKELLTKDHRRFHGRGIMMSDNDFDFIAYNEIGNSVLFGKKINK
jgi:CheY-like chemotaxis protein